MTLGAGDTGCWKHLAQEILTPRTTPRTSLSQKASVNSRSSSKASVCSNGIERPRFDIPTPRSWLNTIDSDHSGHISKEGRHGRPPGGERSSSKASVNSNGVERSSSKASVNSNGVERSSSKASVATRSSSKVSVNSNGVERPRFDILTLRSWFNTIDCDHNGHVSKQEWYKFLRDNPKLKYFVLNGNSHMPPPGFRDRATEEAAQVRRTETIEMKRLIQVWKEIDLDGNGSLEWEEFVEFFRRTGNLLEYKTHGHPMGRLSQILADMHATPSEANEASLEEFEALAKGNLQGARRRSIELSALAQCVPESPAAARITRRQSSRIHSAEEA